MNKIKATGTIECVCGQIVQTFDNKLMFHYSEYPKVCKAIAKAEGSL
jgi:hypothetical protein